MAYEELKYLLKNVKGDAASHNNSHVCCVVAVECCDCRTPALTLCVYVVVLRELKHVLQNVKGEAASHKSSHVCCVACGEFEMGALLH